VVVVGIGADGWSGLAAPARAALDAADVVLGGPRQLDLLPPSVIADRIAWPSPLKPALRGLLQAHQGRAVCVLASGDPMFHGIGATLAGLIGPDRLRVLPHPSSASLAAARLGWPLATTEVVSLVTAPAETLLATVNPGRRVLVLSAGAATPGRVASLLTEHGYGRSTLTVLSQLGGAGETAVRGIAETWSAEVDPLNVIAIECDGPPRPVTPGLPDDAYETDGQLTKREVRAVTLALLSPVPGELLWDVGAGSGSIGIEWMRAHRDCRAVAVEPSPERAGRIVRNAAALGVPGLTVVVGRAPEAVAGLEPPDVIFIGGGLTGDGVVEACLAALRPGGRLVATAVTLESSAVLTSWQAKLGGELVRVAIDRSAAVGGFTVLRPALPVVLWSVTP
jgi:precorrin-6B C5,15-methyltransferase / cobalt-precorrin-6B C5,C15-methyltransferase